MAPRDRTVTVRHLCHNQGDAAPAPRTGWNIACFAERSGEGMPGHMETYRPRLKGLEIAWDPDVLHVRSRGMLVAHPPVARVTPKRGTAWVTGELVENGRKVAVVTEHRVNDPDGSKHPSTRALRRVLWQVHAARTSALCKRLEKRGYVVLHAGDINDHDAKVPPLVRHLTGRYDALAASDEARLVGRVEHGPRGISDHRQFTATYRISAA